jgi:hypothetical protein
MYAGLDVTGIRPNDGSALVNGWGTMGRTSC